MRVASWVRVMLRRRRVLRSPSLSMTVHALVLNLQSLITNLKPIHLLDCGFCRHHRVIRNKAYATTGVRKGNRLTYAKDCCIEKHLPNPLLSPVYLST